MIDMLSKNYHILSNLKGDSKGAYFLPVVFTTADLWFSDVELSSAQIESGNVDLTNSTFTKQSWVTYQYHQSPGIKHSSSPENVPSDFSKLMNTEYIRTIPFVNSAGIESFLEWSSGFDFFD